MAIHEISVPVRPELHGYAGDPPTLIEPWTRLAAGDMASISRVSLGTHTGTHVDAPAHFLPDGRTVDQLDLGGCIGPAEVLDLTRFGLAPIDASVLERLAPPNVERLLLKTENSRLWRATEAQTTFAALTEEAAAWLVARGLRLIGIDYLSIAPFSDPAPVHRILLSAGIVILEGLDLSAVSEGSYTLLCLPVRLAGGDGAPARAVLLSED